LELRVRADVKNIASQPKSYTLLKNPWDITFKEVERKFSVLWKSSLIISQEDAYINMLRKILTSKEGLVLSTWEVDLCRALNLSFQRSAVPLLIKIENNIARLYQEEY
jgi:hypothetical protein